MRAAFVTHADCLKHEMGASHPERPARLAAIEDELIASGIGQHLERYDAPLATDEQLARVHPIEYVKAIREVARSAACRPQRFIAPFGARWPRPPRSARSRSRL